MSSSSSSGGRQAVLVERAPHLLGKFRVPQLMRRDVQRQARRRDLAVAPARELRARGIEHPAAEVDDEAALFRRRHELARKSHAVARRLPAQQRLDALRARRPTRELRLVEERELAAAQARDAVRVSVGADGFVVMLTSKNIARPRPRSLARYMAMSALRISSSIDVLSSGNSVMPMLAQT